jgi:modification methylase, hemK family
MQLQALIQNPAYKKKFVLEKLLCHCLDKTRTELWTDAEQELSEELVKKIQEDYRAYEEDEKPLEYILGFVEFFGVRFWVNEHTLIPRPETEYMITAITEELQSREDSDHILLDIGTGSGVL